MSPESCILRSLVLQQPEPGLADFSPEELLNSCIRHRVVGMMADILNSSEWEVYYRLLYDWQQQCIKKFNNDFSAFCNFHADINQDGNDPVSFLMLKGNTLFFLTGEEKFIRQSADFDILIDNLTLLKKRLKEKGIDYHETPYDHEDGGLSYQGIDIDCHKYFPVWSIISQGGSISSENVICYSQEKNQKIYFTLPNKDYYTSLHKSIYVCSPTLAAIITLSHLYIDFAKLHSPFGSDRSRVRLHEIVEILSLLTTRSFDTHLFIEFIKTYSMEKQLNFLADLLSSLDCPLPELFLHFGLKSSNTDSLTAMVSLWPDINIKARFNASDIISGQYGLNDVLKTLPLQTIYYEMLPGNASIFSGQHPMITYSNGCKFDYRLDLNCHKNTFGMLFSIDKIINQYVDCGRISSDIHLSIGLFMNNGAVLYHDESIRNYCGHPVSYKLSQDSQRFHLQFTVDECASLFPDEDNVLSVFITQSSGITLNSQTATFIHIRR
jgi:hypothetical protein